MTDIPATRASLLLRLREPRDEAAWKEFVELYAPLVYNYARKHGLQDADAMDLSQEVIVAVAGAVGGLEYDPQRGSFRSWLFTIVYRRLLNWRRRQRIRPKGTGDTGMHKLLEQCPDGIEEDADWQAEWDQRVFTWACERVRRDVSETTWRAFWQTAVEGKPGKEVAASLDLSVTAVYLARSRVVARLKAIVQSVEQDL